jgi:hypothetical protein
MYGPAKVGKISHARMPWPIRAKSRSLILCGDLVRAVEKEAEQAVAYHWGVTIGTVWKWRRLLGVGRCTEGTLALADLGAPHRVRSAKERALAPRKRPRRKPSHLPSFLFPSPAQSVLGKLRGPVNPKAKPWVASEDQLLGTMPDRTLAKQLERTPLAVAARRRLLGLPPVLTAKRWRPDELELLGKVSDQELSNRTGHPRGSVCVKRNKLGRSEPGEKLPSWKRRQPEPVASTEPKNSGQSWLPKEDRLLGTMSDVEAAVKLGRSVDAVRARRVGLNLPLAEPLVEPWTAEELSVLGKLPDREAAAKTGRTPIAVALKRRKLRIAQVSPGHRPWRPDEDLLLGTLPDGELAKRLGRTIVAVSNHRRRQGISSTS